MVSIFNTVSKPKSKNFCSIGYTRTIQKTSNLEKFVKQPFRENNLHALEIFPKLLVLASIAIQQQHVVTCAEMKRCW